MKDFRVHEFHESMDYSHKFLIPYPVYMYIYILYTYDIYLFINRTYYTFYAIHVLINI